jgi:hypothetical protein
MPRLVRAESVETHGEHLVFLRSEANYLPSKSKKTVTNLLVKQGGDAYGYSRRARKLQYCMPVPTVILLIQARLAGSGELKS